MAAIVKQKQKCPLDPSPRLKLVYNEYPEIDKQDLGIGCTCALGIVSVMLGL